MGHPLIDEFCRAKSFQPQFLSRCQREFRDVIQPLLDDRDRLLEENAALKAAAEPKGRKKAEATTV